MQHAFCRLSARCPNKITKGLEFSEARKKIVKRLKRMLAYERFIQQPEKEAEHHRMRIMAKRLRYTMEYFQPLFEHRLDKPIEAAQNIQRMLGEIHDCDVWVRYLPQFLEKQAQKSQAIEPGIMYLRKERSRRRAIQFKRFSVYWKKIKRERLWTDLMELLAEKESSI